MPQALTFACVPASPAAFGGDRRTLRLRDRSAPGFPLARGHFQFPRPADLLVASDASGRPRAVFARDVTHRLIAQIWPPYQAQLRHRRERLQARVAVTDEQVAEARAFIEQNHPRGAARAGMLLTLRSQDEGAGGASPGLVAAAQIGAYYHVSLPGRAAFACRLAGDCALGRAALIQAVPIAAGARYAVREDRRGARLGDVLARQVLTVAANYRWPPARVVEVSRRTKARSFFALCKGARQDFLTRACYIPVPPLNWRTEGTLHEPASDRRIAAYYYADLSEHPRVAAITRALAVPI